MTPFPAHRLQKLLLLLSSDQPGEVVNAAGMIGVTLRGAGRDWHDLARVLTNDQLDPGRWREQLALCLAHQAALNPREQDFLLSLKNWRGQPTAKQLAWLAAIFARVSDHKDF